MQNFKLSQKSLMVVGIGITLALFLCFTFLLFIYERNNSPLPKISRVIPFELTDSRNLPFNSLEQLTGKVWVAKLFFTTCSGVCPVLSKNMASLYRSYNLDKRVHFVSITVNPDNDTFDVLAQYAKRYQADPAQWHFLTGPIESIKDISINKLKIGNKEEPVFHSQYFVLIDPKGWIRGYYDGMTAQGTKNIFKDIARLLKERH